MATASPDTFSTTGTLKHSSSSSSSSSSPPASPASQHTPKATVKKFTDLKNAPEEAASLPHHLTNPNGSFKRFQNPYPSRGTPISPFRDVFWPLLTGEMTTPDTSPPTVNVTTPKFLPPSQKPTSLRATWLGHACYFVEFPSGLRVLFDPVFEDRCSPLSFIGPKRFTPKPCEISEIPAVDVVAISHSHYDHLSHGSIKEVQKHHPGAHFFVGLGLEKWFRKEGIRNVTELDWWHDAELSVVKKTSDSNKEKPEEHITARVSCLPAQHTSARDVFHRDLDTTLWCSWAVKSNEKSVWFGGDTGYRAVPRSFPIRGGDEYAPEYESLPRCPQFKQIGALRGPFDLGLIPIGAYQPRKAWSSVHASPADAVEIFRDTKCRRAMGIHWGTWALTMEEVLEPPVLLKEALKRHGMPEEGVFDVCQIGESRDF